jgi:Flp pilus assembly protein TadG
MSALGRATSVLGRFRSCEDGSATVWNLMWLLTLVGIGGLAVDYASAVQTKSQLQTAADAAALSAALDLPDATRARTTAQDYVARVTGTPQSGTVTSAGDVVVGHYDPATRIFQTNVQPFDAVAVRARRTEASGNPLQSFLLRFIGVGQMDLSAMAVAMRRGGETVCPTGGFFSANHIESGSNNTYRDFCLHGELGVKISSDNSFQSRSEVSMRSLSNFLQGGNNTGISQALRQRSMPVPLPGRIPTILSQLRELPNGTVVNRPAVLPSYITRVVRLNSLSPTTAIQQGTLYIVSGVADFGSNRTLENIAVVSTLETKTGSNVTMRNVFFATDLKLLFGSTNVFGDLGVCSGGAYSIIGLARDNIEFGSQSYYRGMLLGTQRELKLGSETRGILGVRGEATGLITYGSNDTFAGCAAGLTSPLDPPATAMNVALVR